MPFLHYTLQFWPRVTDALLALYPSVLDQASLMPFLHCTLQFGPRVTYALLPLYPSFLTKSHWCPYALLPVHPSILTMSHLYPSSTIPFSFDQESLMSFLHYTLQFWPRVTYPFLHYTLQFGPRVTYALLPLYPSILTKSSIPFNSDHESLEALLALYPSIGTKSHLSVPFFHYTLQLVMFCFPCVELSRIQDNGDTLKGSQKHVQVRIDTKWHIL